MMFDLIISITLIAVGFAASYLAAKKKRINYVFGLMSYLLTAYVAFLNGLFGIFFFYVFVFGPLQVYGFFAWGKKLDKNKNVKVRRFSYKEGIIIFLACTVGSGVLGYILTLIPFQKVPFLDAVLNFIGLSASILTILRYREAWWLWTLQSIIGIIVWSIALLEGGAGAIATLIANIGFLFINIRGTYLWSLKKR